MTTDIDFEDAAKQIVRARARHMAITRSVASLPRFIGTGPTT